MKLTFPNPMVILVGFILFAALMTHILPAGEYQRELNETTGRNVVIPGSYQNVEADPVGFWETFVKIPEGLIDRADVIALILLIGGAFYVVDQTGAFNEGLQYLIYKFRNAKYVVMILVGIAFAAGGAFENMQEEIIAMVPVILMLSQKLGYKKFVAVGISLGSAMVGAAFSPINPFQVMIAQKIAEVTVFSGAVFRTFFLIVAVGFWIFWLLKNGKDPEAKSIDSNIEPSGIKANIMIIFGLLALTFSLMIYGIIVWGWGFNEMSASFFVFGVLAGLFGKLGLNGTAKAYSGGFKDMAFAAVIVGLAGSISLVLEDGKVIDTIVHGMFSPLEGLPTSLTAIGMMISHSIIHMPVPSVSGQAVLTMPLLTPLADLLGMSRQVMIMCYQYGAGLADLVMPTNGGLMAVILAAHLSFKDWIKQIYKPVLVVYGIGIISILIALAINLN